MSQVNQNINVRHFFSIFRFDLNKKKHAVNKILITLYNLIQLSSYFSFELCSYFFHLVNTFSNIRHVMWWHHRVRTAWNGERGKVFTSCCWKNEWFNCSGFYLIYNYCSKQDVNNHLLQPLEGLSRSDSYGWKCTDKICSSCVRSALRLLDDLLYRSYR